MGKANCKSKLKPKGKRLVNSFNHKPVNSLDVFNGLNCIYTNADQFRNKLNELKVRIRDNLPKIIGITEVKPKNSQYKLNPAEFSLDFP